MSAFDVFFTKISVSKLDYFITSLHLQIFLFLQNHNRKTTENVFCVFNFHNFTLFFVCIYIYLQVTLFYVQHRYAITLLMIDYTSSVSI